MAARSQGAGPAGRGGVWGCSSPLVLVPGSRTSSGSRAPRARALRRRFIGPAFRITLAGHGFWAAAACFRAATGALPPEEALGAWDTRFPGQTALVPYMPLARRSPKKLLGATGGRAT